MGAAGPEGGSLGEAGRSDDPRVEGPLQGGDHPLPAAQNVTGDHPLPAALNVTSDHPLQNTTGDHPLPTGSSECNRWSPATRSSKCNQLSSATGSSECSRRSAASNYNRRSAATGSSKSKRDQLFVLGIAELLWDINMHRLKIGSMQTYDVVYT